ncbi:MAG: site-specific integrase, partial [Turicibacter sp.]|nr:site-specific integrase [Turicibacter sp.]
LADANPADNIEPPKRKKGRAYRTKFLSDADIGQLVDALGKLETDYNSERFRVLILLGLNTGLRVAEALALTWDDVDFKKKKLAVTKKLVADGTIEDFTKSKEDRFVPLGAFIQGALKTWKAEQAEQAVRFGLQKTCPFENLTDSALMQSHNTRIRLMRFVKSNDLPYFTYHDLRHTYGSLLAANGIEFTEIQRRLGHKDLGTTLSRYIHARQEPDAKAEEILDQIFCRMPR